MVTELIFQMQIHTRREFRHSYLPDARESGLERLLDNRPKGVKI